MIEQEIIEGNKLIAEFMEYRFKNQSKYWCIYPLDDNSFLRNLGWVEFNNLKFHSSWDWLMPCIGKISNIPTNYPDGIYKYLVNVDLNPITGIKIEDMYKRNFDFEDGVSINIYESNFIMNVWYGVVEFIKWYNSCQKE